MNYSVKLVLMVGLMSLFCGCVHNPTGLPVAGESIRIINLSQIESNPDFTAIQADTFQYKREVGVDVKLRRVSFNTDPQAALYLQNRKMFLDQTFKNNIAPYFGVIEVQPACYALAKTEAVEKTTSAMTTFFMEFPMANPMVISECIGGPVAGIARYDFYYCRKNQTVYEMRSFRKIDQPVASFQVDCE